MRIRTWIRILLVTLNADPDPACHFDADPDPTFHFDADPDMDPSFAVKVQNLENNAQIGLYSIHFCLSSANCCGSGSGFSLSLWCGAGAGSSLSLWCGSGSAWNWKVEQYCFNFLKHMLAYTEHACGELMLLSLLQFWSWLRAGSCSTRSSRRRDSTRRRPSYTSTRLPPPSSTCITRCLSPNQCWGSVTFWCGSGSETRIRTSD